MDQPAQVSPLDAYWESRKDNIYLQVVRSLVSGLGKKAASLLDVGTAGCPYLEWFPHIPNRVSVDLTRPYEAPGVTGIKADFLLWTPPEKYQLVLCLQVLEHVRRADLFARKLLSVGGTVIISVPYKWPKGRTRSHVHDPIDEEKLVRWFRREPNFSYLCREVTADSDRLIQVYERNNDVWSNLNQRARIRAERKKERAERLARAQDLTPA
jgi:hypothetical protein